MRFVRYGRGGSHIIDLDAVRYGQIYDNAVMVLYGDHGEIGTVGPSDLEAILKEFNVKDLVK